MFFQQLLEWIGYSADLVEVMGTRKGARGENNIN